MPSGSCLCGESTYEYSGEPIAKVACHCLPCRKSSGTPNSVNILVSDDNFKVTGGKLKEWKRGSDSGAEGMTIVKAGTLDSSEDIEKVKPEAEIYCKNRIGWTSEYAGAKQTQGLRSNGMYRGRRK